MPPRSHSKSVVFSHPFELKGVDRILPAGDYRVVTDEELIEELSFPVYRRISTMIFLPGQGRQESRPSKRNPTRLWAHGHDRQKHRFRSASRGMVVRKSAALRRLLAWCRLAKRPCSFGKTN
jgi:hypothetical protein